MDYLYFTVYIILYIYIYRISNIVNFPIELGIGPVILFLCNFLLFKIIICEGKSI